MLGPLLRSGERQIRFRSFMDFSKIETGNWVSCVFVPLRVDISHVIACAYPSDAKVQAENEMHCCTLYLPPGSRPMLNCQSGGTNPFVGGRWNLLSSVAIQLEIEIVVATFYLNARSDS